MTADVQPELAAHRPICGAPCPNGGKESTRRRSRADLGWMGHCNRRVQREGDRCFMHLLPSQSLPQCSGTGMPPRSGGDRARCPVCGLAIHVRLDGTVGTHGRPKAPHKNRAHWRGGIERVDLPGEEWRAIPGWEDTHEVSSMGRVYSVKREGVLNSGRILRQNLRNGYATVSLKQGDGTAKRLSVHRLMMHAFVGPQESGVVVRHLDGQSTNNVLSNLKYGTFSENEADKVAHGTHHWASKTHCPQNHPYDEANTYVYRGSRHCRTCHRERCRARDALRRAAA